jgi:hypothetical protein
MSAFRTRWKVRVSGLGSWRGLETIRFAVMSAFDPLQTLPRPRTVPSELNCGVGPGTEPRKAYKRPNRECAENGSLEEIDQEPAVNSTGADQ